MLDPNIKVNNAGYNYTTRYLRGKNKFVCIAWYWDFSKAFFLNEVKQRKNFTKCKIFSLLSKCFQLNYPLFLKSEYLLYDYSWWMV